MYFAIYAHGRLMGYTRTWQAAEMLCIRAGPGPGPGYDWDVVRVNPRDGPPRASVLDDDAPDASAPSPNYRPGS